MVFLRSHTLCLMSMSEEHVQVHHSTSLSLWLPNAFSLVWKALAKGPQWKPVTSVAFGLGVQFVL